MLSAVELLNILTALLYVVMGAYFLSFRPAALAPALLGVYFLASAVDNVDLDNSRVLYALLWVASASLYTLIAVYPTRVRWKSLSGVILGVGILQLVLSAGYILFADVTPVTRLQELDRMVIPGSHADTIISAAFVLARWRELPRELDRTGHAARLVYLVTPAVVLVGGGFVLGQSLGGALGASTFPPFLYETAGLAFFLGSAAIWWVVPFAVASYALVRWRWPLPAWLIAAGFASGVTAIVFKPDADSVTYIAVRGWGTFLVPALAMFAQARWSAFEGEPVGLRPTVGITIIASLFAYAFGFAMVLVFIHDPAVAFAVAPVLGLVAAVAMAVAVLPRARKLEVRRLFVRGTAADASPTPLVPGVLVLGRYKIVRLLAEGGQGRVYEATDQRTGARLVLKATAGDGVLHESRVLRELRHPNIVRFVDIIEDTGFTLLVLEYAEGGDLRGLMTRRGVLGAQEVARLIDGILAGLGAAHARGFVHGDVKPENVLLDAKETPILADFGVARSVGPEATIQVGGSGTLGYFAPERIRGAGPTPQTDVYAVAVVAHELLAGKPPFPAQGDDFATRRSILGAGLQLSLPADAARFAPLLTRALSADPAIRPADADTMRALWNASAGEDSDAGARLGSEAHPFE